MRFSTKVRDITEEVVQSSSFARKWEIDGYTAWDLGENIEVVVSRRRHLPNLEVLQAAVDHELGHAKQFAEGDIRDGDSPLGRFWHEVNAWEVRAGQKGFGRGVGELVLDALNTYRRSLDVPDGQWRVARQHVERWCMEDLSDYEPLEPDPEDTQPPCALHPEGFEPKGNGGRTPEGDREGKPGQPKEGGGGGEDRDGEVLHAGQKTFDEDRVARDAWLLSPEGMGHVHRNGARYLQDILGTRGWTMSELPPLVLAILEGKNQ